MLLLFSVGTSALLDLVRVGEGYTRPPVAPATAEGRRRDLAPAGFFRRRVLKGGLPVSAAGRQSEKETGLNVSMMTRVALMAAVTAVAAQITIPLNPVPFTFQVLAVVLSGLLLGPRYGALAQAVYVLVGAVGVPVFAGLKGGLGIVFGETGGYLLAYPIAAALAGLAAHAVASAPRRRALVSGFLWGCAALAVIYALGATWLAVIAGLSPGAALAAGVLPFVAFDLIKVGLAALVAVAAAPAIATARA